MSKTKEHMLQNGITPSNGTDTDDTYQNQTQPQYNKEQEDEIYNELFEEHIMREAHRRTVELGHHHEEGL